jgi:hypothetical protein
MSDVMVNWNEVADDGTLPSMRANAVLKTWKQDKTSTERLMYRVGWMIEDPEKYRGMFVNDNMICGAGPDAPDEAKMNFDPHQRDSRRLSTMFSALQVQKTENLYKCFKSAEEGKCVVFITEPSQSDITAGYDRNKVRNYFTLGSVDVGLINGDARAPVATPAMPPPPVTSHMPRPVARSDEDTPD